MSHAVLRDLLDTHPKILQAGRKRELVYEIDMTISIGQPQDMVGDESLRYDQLSWNIDLAVGPPPEDLDPRAPEKFGGELIPETDMLRIAPETLFLVADMKGIMSSIPNNRRNRQRDLVALSSMVHDLYPFCVVGGLLPINISPVWRGKSTHQVTKTIDDIVEETLGIFRAYRSGKNEGSTWRIDALTLFPIVFDGESHEDVRLHQGPPAPGEGDSLFYAQFIEDMGYLILGRFGYTLGRGR